MAERKKYDSGLIAVGKLITDKRKALGASYQTREGFINNRSEEIFGGEAWISIRHLTNLELGKKLVKYRNVTQTFCCLRGRSY